MSIITYGIRKAKKKPDYTNLRRYNKKSKERNNNDTNIKEDIQRRKRKRPAIYDAKIGLDLNAWMTSCGEKEKKVRKIEIIRNNIIKCNTKGSESEASRKRKRKYEQCYTNGSQLVDSRTTEVDNRKSHTDGLPLVTNRNNVIECNTNRSSPVASRKRKRKYEENKPRHYSM